MTTGHSMGETIEELFGTSLRAIKDRIAAIEDEFRENQALILTEDDLKCLLYRELSMIFGLSGRRKTQDTGVYGTPIHTEVSWYDREERLSITPDITILEPEHLSILHGIGKRGKVNLPLPSKGCRFVGKAITFELKFVRQKGGITPHVVSRIKNDYDKIQVLHDKYVSSGLADQLFCFFVIFNKTNNHCRRFAEFLESKKRDSWSEIVYATGKVEFPGVSQSEGPFLDPTPGLHCW